MFTSTKKFCTPKKAHDNDRKHSVIDILTFAIFNKLFNFKINAVIMSILVYL